MLRSGKIIPLLLISIIYFECLFKYFIELIINVSALSLIADFLIFLICLYIVISTSRGLIILSSFFILSTITFFLGNVISLNDHLFGIRDLTVLISVFIIFSYVYSNRIRDSFSIYFNNFISLFLKAQLVFSVVQFFIFGPGDQVTGTLGKGGSGILTITIFLLVFYRLTFKYRNPNEFRLKNIYPFLPYFIPIFLNETKVSLIVAAMFFISLIKFNSIKSVLGIAISGVIFVLLFSNLYTSQEEHHLTKNPLQAFTSEEFIDFYLIGLDKVEYYNDIPRIGKMYLGVDVLARNEMLAVGAEYSAFNGESLSKTNFAEDYDWLLTGSRPLLFYLLISGGVVLICYFLITTTYYLTLENGSQFKIKSLVFFNIMMFALLLLYNDNMRYLNFSLLFVNSIFFSRYGKLILNGKK